MNGQPRGRSERRRVAVRRVDEPASGAVVYDTGALLAIERRDTRMAQVHQLAVSTAGMRPIVPVVVFAQAWRGARQVLLSRMLKDCDIVPDSLRVGRAAGELCSAAGTSDVIDAMVVVLALSLGAGVVTSDPGDLTRLAGALGQALPMYVV